MNQIKMNKQLFFTILFFTAVFHGSAQVVTVDSATQSVLSVTADSRLERLAAIEAKANATASSSSPAVSGTKKLGPRAAMGYRLMVLSTNDRNLAMNVRSKLLQHFPEQRVYMTFHSPYIKIKFGNFISWDAAKNYRKNIINGRIVTTNVYVVQEVIEVKPEKSQDKTKEKEKDKDKNKKK